MASRSRSDTRRRPLEEARAGYAAGATSTTHLFNAMTGIDHRAPGVALAALLEDAAYVELIADGLHVDRALWPLITRLKPADRLLLVSDAVALAGMGDGGLDRRARGRGRRSARHAGRVPRRSPARRSPSTARSATSWRRASRCRPPSPRRAATPSPSSASQIAAGSHRASAPTSSSSTGSSASAA